MNDRNSIYLKKLNRCTRSRLTGSSSIVRIHSDFTVRDSYMTRWVEHGCPESFMPSMNNRYTMHMQLIFTMYGSIWDLQKLWCISYVEYVSYANHQSDFYLREESLRLVTWSIGSGVGQQVWYHLVFFFFWPGLTIFPRNARWIQPPEYSDGYERAYDMLMKWKWIQPLRFLDSIMRWMWVLTTNFPMSILHSLDIVCGFDSI